jgi:chromosome segregation ATPase
MSVEFSNAYQEILLDNFNSVIKQNLMFQTQLKMTEEAQKNNKSDDKINLLNGEYNVLKAEYDAALKKIAELEPRANVGQSLHDEKTRIQSALNEEMRKNAVLREEVNQKSSVIEEHNKKIAEQSAIIETQSKTIADCKNELIIENKKIEELNSSLEKKEPIVFKTKKTNSKTNTDNVADGSSF